LSLFLESEGRIVVGKDDPDPLKCPDCGKLFDGALGTGGKMRCPSCRYQGTKNEFKTKVAQVAEARVLVAV
jgi:tRNA(Ile2) C34 agmatinyltransferase TiaS